MPLTQAAELPEPACSEILEGPHGSFQKLVCHLGAWHSDDHEALHRSGAVVRWLRAVPAPAAPAEPAPIPQGWHGVFQGGRR